MGFHAQNVYLGRYLCWLYLSARMGSAILGTYSVEVGYDGGQKVPGLHTP